MIEVWTRIPIKGLERWDVSTMGNFRRNCPGGGTYVGRMRKKVIKRDTLGRPFATISFPAPDKPKRPCGRSGTRFYKVSVLILTAFVGPRPTRHHMASHLDDDPLGDRLTNLAWETRAQNEKRKNINHLLQQAYAERS